MFKTLYRFKSLEHRDKGNTARTMKLLKAGAESCGQYTNGDVMGSRGGKRGPPSAPRTPATRSFLWRTCNCAHAENS